MYSKGFRELEEEKAKKLARYKAKIILGSVLVIAAILTIGELWNQR